MQLLDNFPFLVGWDEGTQSKAFPRGLVELVHVAEGGDDILELNGAVENMGYGVPTRLHGTHEYLALQPSLLGKSGELGAHCWTIPDFV